MKGSGIFALVCAALVAWAPMEAAAALRTPTVAGGTQPPRSQLPTQCPSRGFRAREPAGLVIIGLSPGMPVSTLSCFYELAPGQTVTIIGTITGLVGSEYMQSIDYRVQDGQLYGVGSSGRVYRIDVETAAATQIGQIEGYSGGGFAMGMDFDPVADRLRIINEVGENFVFDVTTGTTVREEDSFETGIAYTNNDLAPETGTVLFSLNQDLYIVSPPELGTRVRVGALRIWEDIPEEPHLPYELDAYSVVRNGVATSNQLLGIVHMWDFYSGPTLLGIDLSTGKAVVRGLIGSPFPSDIAIPLGQR